MALNENFFIAGAPNWVDSGTIEGDSEVATLPLVNLQNAAIGKVWRSTTVSPTSTKIRVDFGSSRPVDVVALVRHNLTSGSEWRIGLDDSGFPADPAAGDYDSTLVTTFAEANWARNIAVHILPNRVTARYLQVWLSDGSNPDGFLEAANLLASEAIQPDLNVEYDLSMRPVDPSERLVTDRGSLHHLKKAFHRVIQCSWSDLTIDEAETFMRRLDVGLGRTGNLLLVQRPSVTARWYLENVWGVQEETAETRAPYWESYSRGLTIRERT